jgi:hypothetical protein
MKAVETVGAHVVGKSARATDSRDHHRHLGGKLLVAADALQRCENAVIAATRTPTCLATRVIAYREIALMNV